MSKKNKKLRNYLIAWNIFKYSSLIFFSYILFCIVGGFVLLGFLWYEYRDPDCITKRVTKPRHFKRLIAKKKCINCYLGNADLRGLNLSGANLSRAKLVEARLDNVNLAGANLSRVELNWYESNGGHGMSSPKCDVNISASLKKANLTNANLSEARLSGANLESANLNNANLSNAFILRANFENADLRNANLTVDAYLSSTSLKGAKYNNQTIFPSDFDPEKEGMIYVP